MQEMYNAKLGSPITTLAEDISSSQTTITVADASFLGAAPNIATITTGVNSETVKYTGITLNTLTGVTRGFQGSAQAWASGTNIARIITAYDHDTFKANIEEIFADVGDLTNLNTTDKTNLVGAINEVDGDLATHKAESTAQLLIVTRDMSLTGVQNLSNLAGRKIKSATILSSVPGTNKSCIGLYTLTFGQRAQYVDNDIQKVFDSTDRAIVISQNSTADRTLGLIQNVAQGGFEINWSHLGTGATGTANVKILIQYHGE